MFLFSIISCQQEFIKMQDQNVDNIKISKFEKIAISYFNTLETGKTYNFKNIANKEFNDKMTPDFQLESYSKIKQEFGELESLKFSGIWTRKTNNNIQLIRFKGKFNKSNNPLEIRVVLNRINKITGFWIKPWKNNLNSII